MLVKSLFAFLILLLGAFWCLPVAGQNIQNPQSAVDNLMRSDLRVDPATGALQIQIPLGEIRGRGEAVLPVVLNYSSKVWNIKFQGTLACGGEPVTSYRPEYAKSSASGWTSSLGWFLPQPDLSLETYEGIRGKPAQTGTTLYRIMRKFVTLPDGSRHEVRRDDARHNPSESQFGIYYAVDGSRLVYDFNVSTPTVYLPNGTRIVGGPQYIDRQGNFMSYNFETDRWTDTLGRSIGIPIPGKAPTTAGDVVYTLPSGVSYTLRWRQMGDVLTDPSQSLRFYGDAPSANCQLGTAQPGTLFSTLDGNNKVLKVGLFNPVVLWQIGLPNNTNYKFTYNVWGEIDKVVYPTGGDEKFTYDYWDPLGGQLDDGTYSQANRGVYSRSVNDGVNPPQIWSYSPASNMRAVTAPDGTVTQTSYYASRGLNIQYGFDDARAGMVREVRTYNAAGTMLRRTINQVVMDGPLPGGYPTATRSPRVTKTVDIILDTGGDASAATTEMTYDTDLNLTSTKQYGFVPISQTTAQTADHTSIPLGTLLRTTETDYLTSDPNYRARNLLSLPIATRVKNGSGTLMAQTAISYDEAAFPLLLYGSVTGWSDPGTTARGNATTTSVWLNTTGTNLQSHVQYDQCGNPRKVWDARDTALTNPSQIEYSAAYQFAYPTLSTSADPDGNGPLTPLVTTATYDSATGLVTAATDANGQQITFSYNDPLQRLTQVIGAAGDAGARNQTTYSYDDAGRTITVSSDLNIFNDNALKVATVYDGLGRPAEGRQYEDGTNYITTQTQYDIMGRPYKRSNPFRSGETVRWTTTAFDSLGRVITITTPDNAVVSTSYSGNTVTVTDQAGKTKKTISDALGHLIEVYEAPNDPNYNYLTSYDYDALGNLLHVYQGSQTRTFTYDSLSRLRSATNPESGTVDYDYDENGNLKTKMDSRFLPGTSTRVTTSSVYDALNRPTSLSYNDGTPTITYTYDAANVANSRGRLTSISSSFSSYSYGEYDARGRVKTGTQSTAGQAYTMNYTYNAAGGLTSERYPSGRVVKTEYDSAGRLAGISNNSTGAYYAGAAATDTPNRVQYTAAGGIQAMKLGNGLWEHTNFNERLQPTQIGLGSASTNSSILQLDYGYGSTDNNGNVRTQSITVPSVGGVTGFAATQIYTYDPLNRLATAQENNGSSWRQNFDYDRYGNRKFISGTTVPTLTPANNPIINPLNNRIDSTASGQGNILYDSAGNLTRDVAGHSYQYDAENKMVSYDGGASAGGASYYYDGNGQRVKKVVGGASIVTTILVYDINSQLVAEYADSSPSGAGTSYVTSDMLGSFRVITGTTQQVLGRHDYLPFGEEVFAGIGSRTPQQNFGADNLRQKFTAYERDAETDLDFANARFYSHTQGRYSSPDRYNIIFEMKAGRSDKDRAQFLMAYISDPRNWNRYNYVLNDPLNLIDPSGMVWLTRDNKEYIWVDEKEYSKNADAYKDYTIADGAIMTYQGSMDCSVCDGLKEGDLVQLNENGKIDKLDPKEAMNVTDEFYTSYSAGYGYFSMGGIRDADNQLYATFGLGKSWANHSFSVTEGRGKPKEGLYLQGTFSNGMVINESLNVFHPTEPLSMESGYGSPNIGIGLQVTIGPFKGTTDWDRAHHVESGSPHRVLTGGGRCPY